MDAGLNWKKNVCFRRIAAADQGQVYPAPVEAGGLVMPAWSGCRSTPVTRNQARALKIKAAVISTLVAFERGSASGRVTSLRECLPGFNP